MQKQYFVIEEAEGQTGTISLSETMPAVDAPINVLGTITIECDNPLILKIVERMETQLCDL